MSQIFLHLITGDPTIPHGASSRRSHGEQNHVGRPQKTQLMFKLLNISSQVDEYWPSTPTPLSHWRKIFNNSSAVHFFSSGTTKLFSYFFFFSSSYKLFQLPPLRLSKAEGPPRATILRLRPPGTSLLPPVLFWISRFLIKPQK